MQQGGPDGGASRGIDQGRLRPYLRAETALRLPGSAPGSGGRLDYLELVEAVGFEEPNPTATVSMRVDSASLLTR